MEAILFDLDGTLVYQEPIHRYKLVGQTLKHLGLRALQRDIDRFWFEPLRDDIIRESFGIDPDEFWSVYVDFDTVELRANYTHAYNDVDAIHKLKESGFLIGIVTSASAWIVEFELSLVGESIADAVVSANRYTGVKKKPNPEGLLICMNKLGVETAKGYVGNGPEDQGAASAVPLPFIRIDRGEYYYPNFSAEPTLKSLNSLPGYFGIQKP
ncbi:HAD family hydrolase [Candidatus Woesearchaeota archaeon]|nr:HAD family hydrolase [Candidatus Woesearchaeota archaeon]